MSFGNSAGFAFAGLITGPPIHATPATRNIHFKTNNKMFTDLHKSAFLVAKPISIALTIIIRAFAVFGVFTYYGSSSDFAAFFSGFMVLQLFVQLKRKINTTYEDHLKEESIHNSKF